MINCTFTPHACSTGGVCCTTLAVGVSAPPEIAQQYSEHRAHIVAQILEEDFNVNGSRIETRGWGSTVAAMAQSSNHPNAEPAKQGFGWAEVFFVTNEGGLEASYPARPDYYALAVPPSSPPSPPPPPPAPRTRPSSRPIFYMLPTCALTSNPNQSAACSKALRALR